MEGSKLDPTALGYSLGIMGALIMLILSIVGILGFGAEAVTIMAAPTTYGIPSALLG